MIKVRTFATPIKIFATMRELHDLDAQVAAFLAEEGADKVFSMSDSTTVGENGGDHRSHPRRRVPGAGLTAQNATSRSSARRSGWSARRRRGTPSTPPPRPTRAS